MGWRLSLKIFAVAVICVNLNLVRDGYLQGSQTLSYTLFTAWILLWMNTQWQVPEIIFSFLFFVLYVCIQMPMAGCDHLPCCAAMLCHPLPFCAGQLHHGNLHGCWCAPYGLVIKGMLCLECERLPCLFYLLKCHFSLAAFQQTRMRTRTMNSVLRCTRT